MNTSADIDLKNDHNVYILGAGFSREAGLPLISDFLVRMRDSHEWLSAANRQIEADAVKKVLQFRLAAASAAYYVNLDLEDIKELFSLASASAGDMETSIRLAIMATLDYIRQTNPLEQCRMLIASLRGNDGAALFPLAEQNRVSPKYPKWAKPIEQPGNVYPGRVGPFKISKYAFHVAKLLGLFLTGEPKGENTFITFNYDTLLEEALRELGMDCHYGFDASGTKSPSQPTIPVLKLHGSVNWGRSPSSDGRRWPLKIYESCGEMLSNNAQPTLVPPTWKKIFGGPFEIIWESAVQKLTTATRIVIIGFSIPSTDMHFKYLMAAGLQNNVSLRKILFVNPDEKQNIESRARNLLRNSYIDSHLIDFEKVGLNEFTSFQPNRMWAIGRPTEYGLNCDLYPL